MTAADHPDPFGYKARRAEIEAEDREAEELLAGMVASEPENYLRGLLAGNREAEDRLREILTPPDGPYDPADLEIIPPDDD